VKLSKKLGGASGGARQKSGGGMAPPGLPLESPLGATSVDSLWKGATNHERLRTTGLGC